jgi:dienelactone hydrolase
MLRNAVIIGLIFGAIAVRPGVEALQAPYRTHNDRFAAPRYASRDAWSARAAQLRTHILATAGLMPMPERTPLAPSIFGELKRADYTVAKVYFESLPGFFVTGNLYRPIGAGPFPGILSPHGHWTYGRLENTPTNSGPGRAIGLARQGFVVFTFDMVGYGDSHQLPHTFGGRREQLWGLTLAGLQLWNSIRALDFLESLPYVRKDALGATGESGGGTQTFLLAAVDPRVTVAAPVNMISLHMQGGCLCENLPGLRLDTNNVEIAATIAPRPLLMIAATGDWTKETIEVEYPAVRSIYQLFGAADRVHAVRIDAEHNYNKASREAMYAWMARWFKNAPADARIEERAFTVEPLQDLLVFHQRALPAGAVTAAQLTEQWIAGAKRQLASMDSNTARAALRDALGFAGEEAPPAAAPARDSARTVLLAVSDPAIERELVRRRFKVVAIPFRPFDAAAASEVRHFETYNRTAASQRVADIVTALRAHRGAAVVADGDAALAALLALAIEPASAAVLDVDGFDPSSDDAFVERLFVPGLRRAGDVRTAERSWPRDTVLHDARGRFAIPGVRAEARALTAREVVDTLARRAAAR